MPTTKLKIKEFDLDLIHPNKNNYSDPEQGGMKIICLGKPATGKTSLIKSILYSKRHLIPTCTCICGTEDSQGGFGKIIPSSLIYNDYDEEVLKKFIMRQKVARKHCKNPWSFLLIDDAVDNPKNMRAPVVQSLFKNGRHYKMLLVLSLQYVLDCPPNIRSNTDITFILRETNLKNRRSIYENYAGIIPTFELFNFLMDEFTKDYTALVIYNQTTSTDWQDCVFYYRADIEKLKGFKFGSKDIWKYHHHRYNPNYSDPFSI